MHAPCLPKRRRWLVGMVLAAALPGCGFALKRPPQLRSQRIHLAGFARLSPMGAELRRQLRLSPGVTLTEAATEAQWVLHALIDQREQVVASSTATGLVSELTLRVRLRFEVRAPGGAVLIPETELLLTRDMGYSESSAMAKEHEANLLFRAMETDIATQVLRRLAALPAA